MFPRAVGEAEQGAQVDTHLFVIAPNNSGSTLLRNLIAVNAGCLSLPREAQHVPGFVGPSSRGTGTRLIWAARPEWIAQFTDPARYDWARTRDAWRMQARPRDATRRVLVLSSPPFLLIVDMLRAHFPDARFVFLVRNPHAMLEGILRRADQQPVAPGENIVELAASHICATLERQAGNIDRHGDVGIALTYEQLCADPAGAAARIAGLVPSLAGLAFDRAVAVKGEPAAAIADRNARQVAGLRDADRAAAEAVFQRHAALARFGHGVGAP